MLSNLPHFSLYIVKYPVYFCVKRTDNLNHGSFREDGWQREGTAFLHIDLICSGIFLGF